MDEYSSYMKAFGSDINLIAVWEPGHSRELGDYGKMEGKKWKHLGNIWDEDRLTKKHLFLRETATSEAIIEKSLGSANIIQSSNEAGFKGLPGEIGISINFNRENSIFFRAFQCKTESLKRVQTIAEALINIGNWNENWSLVTEVQRAEKFLVIVSKEAGSQITIKAKSDQVLQDFMAGKIDARSNLQMEGAVIRKYVGRKGPISMKLIKLSGPWILRRNIKVEEISAAEGVVNDDAKFFIEDVEIGDFLENL